MSEFLSGLVEVKNKTNERVSDSVDARRQRIEDAKRRMAERRKASSVNRVSDSARPATRGIAAKRASAVQGLTRKQDSASKMYMRLRQRIKDELSETETTEEAVEAAVAVLNEEANENPQEVLNAAEDIITAVVEIVGDLLPEDAGAGEEPAGDDDYVDDDEVADSARRTVVRRRSVADARRADAIRQRIKDSWARRRAMARRTAVKDNLVRRPGVARTARPATVKDSMARRRALAAARRVRDARIRRAAAARPAARTADSRMIRRPVRKG